jgi:uncharacterized SAM-binding protein YcdF (DUF218 family)
MPGITVRRAGWFVVAIACLIGLARWVAAASDISSNLLISTLENRFQRTTIGDETTITGVIAIEGNDDRFREAGELLRRLPHSKLAVSYVVGDRGTLLRLLGGGIAPERLVLEDRSRNTHENAELLTAAVRPMPGERWLLVTSAVHMPRAIGAFRRSGFSVEPWPIFSPLANNADAMHEWIGLAAYWLRGQSSALFPAPIDPPSIKMTDGRSSSLP